MPRRRFARPALVLALTLGAAASGATDCAGEVHVAETGLPSKLLDRFRTG